MTPHNTVTSGPLGLVKHDGKGDRLAAARSWADLPADELAAGRLPNPDDAERKRQRDAELAAFDLEPAPAYPDVEPGDLGQFNSADSGIFESGHAPDPDPYGRQA